MSAASWGLAVVGWLVLGTVPGFLLATALRPTTAAVARWAVAPLVTLAVAYAAAAWVDVLHRGSGVAAAGVALLATVVGSLVVLWRRDRVRSLRPGPWTRDAAILTSVLGVSLVLGLWSVASSPNGWGSVVPYDDGVSHGIFTARLALSGSVDPLQTAVTDVASGSGGVFYPLGLHTVAALVATASGTQAAITAAGVVAAAVWAPLAIASWGWRVLGAVPALVAAALLAVASPWFPTAQLQWGGWTLVAAVALVPAAARVIVDGDGVRGTVLSGLALGGLLALHVSEVVVVALLCLATRALDPASRARILALLRDGALALALGAVVLVPSLGALVARSGGAPVDRFPFDLGQSVLEVLVHPVVGVSLEGELALGTALLVVAWWVLLVAGTRVAWRTPAGRGTVATLWLFVALALLAFLGVASGATLPWYSNGYRLLAQAAALAPLPLAAVVVAVAARAGAARWAGLVVCGVVTAALVVANAGTAATAWRSSVVSSDDRAAFAWLAPRVAPGERVLGDPRDGTGWVYAATGGAVAPVFAMHPDGWRSAPEWADRWYLYDHAAADDPRVDELMTTWDIRYAVVGTGAFPQTGARLSAADLLASSRWREVFCRGAACVFERRSA